MQERLDGPGARGRINVSGGIKFHGPMVAIDCALVFAQQLMSVSPISYCMSVEFVTVLVGYCIASGTDTISLDI